MLKKIFNLSLVLVLAFFVLGKAEADDVYIDKGRNILMVSEGAETPRPYLIKGVVWSPATKAADFFNGNPEGQKAWMKSEFQKYYESKIVTEGSDFGDISLMNVMNVNTARVFIDFGDDPQIIKRILDEFYQFGIRVIMNVASAREELDVDRFDVYTDAGAAYNHYMASGWMGDRGDLQINQEAGAPASGSTCVRIDYNAGRSQGQGWAGVFWQAPENNWGDKPGLNLQGFNKLVFKAKGSTGQEIIDKIQVGGIAGDTAMVVLRNLKLTNSWQEYSINLSNKNLTDIRGGFCIVFSAGNGAQTIYLDDIYFTYDPALGGAKKTAGYEKIVELYKGHPAILLWSIGNEWNFNKLYGYTALEEAAGAVNRAAGAIKVKDPNHPVCSILGDQFSVFKAILEKCPNVDLWGLNIYRGASFGTLFQEWKDLWEIQLRSPAQPFFLSELGTDSFMTSSYSIANGNQADYCRGLEDQDMQAGFDLALWKEIKDHLSISKAGELCLGGLAYEFNDELWKAGNFHSGLGGLKDISANSYGIQDTGGLYLAGAHPDNVANEEYFGVVTAERVPKKAFYALRDFYGELDSLIDATAPLTPKVTDGGAFTVNKNLLYALWKSEDQESGIAQYQYKITQDSISGEVIRDWTSAGTNTYVMALGLNLAQGKAYYFTVKAKNGAGLWSAEGYSDGIVLDTQPLVISNLAIAKIQPQLYRITFRLNRQAKVSAEVYDAKRKQLIVRFASNLTKYPGNNYVNFTGKDSKGNNLPGGSYFLKLKAVAPSGKEFTAVKGFTYKN